MGGLYAHYVRHGIADDSDRFCQKSKGGGSIGQKVAQRPISQVIWDPYGGRMTTTALLKRPPGLVWRRNQTDSKEKESNKI